MAKDKFTIEEMTDAIEAANGVLAQAARNLGCSRQTLYNQMKKKKTIAAAYHEANETNKDFVESQLMRSIRGIRHPDTNELEVAPNVTAMIFFLKTKAKDRGYIEGLQIGNLPGEDIKIKVKVE